MAHAADPKGYYRILGVVPSATAEEIRRAFRDAAKRYHPDQGEEADAQKFLQLTEAYDTLRDGRRRMQYDALRAAHVAQPDVAGQRQATGASRKFGKTDEPTGHPAATRRQGGMRLGGRMTLANGMMLAAAMLAVASIITLGLLFSAQQRLGEQDMLLQQAYARMAQMQRERQQQLEPGSEDASLAGTAMPQLQAAAVPEDGEHGFRTELSFSPEAVDLDAAMQAKADQAILGLIETIERIPAERNWLILLEGFAGRAAEPGGVSVGAWERTLLRLGSVTDYLTAQGMPPERLAVRFQAGMRPQSDGVATDSVIDVKLMCCFR